MLLDPHDWSLAQQIDRVLPALPTSCTHVTPETHSSALELGTGVHADRRARPLEELLGLRIALDDELEPLGLRGRQRGHPPVHRLARDGHLHRERYEAVYGSMRELARREPTFGLHVHVGVPDPEAGHPPAQPHARPPAAAARALGQLAVLAGPRHRPRARRAPRSSRRSRGSASRAPSPTTRTGSTRRPADPQRRLPGAELPLVGRAPAAALRHRRGADPGRADHRRRVGGAGRAGPVHRRARGRGGRAPSERSVPRRRSRRTASSPRATAWRPR